MSMIIQGNYRQQSLQVEVQSGVIQAVSTIAYDAALPLLSPGLVDLQINGYKGIDFNADPLNEVQWELVTKHLVEEGVTTYYPTIITNDLEVLARIFRENREVLEGRPDLLAYIAGFHLEGPYISKEDGPRGAHELAYVKPPNWEEFCHLQEQAGGMIKVVTLSPEWEEAPAFIEQLVRSGVTVSIGHTAATTEQIAAAVQAGASMSTHLGNGAHPLIRRHPNYIWDQLAEANLAVGVIADGHHLPSNVLQVFRKVKDDRMFLVSDSVAIAGMPAGQYVAAVGGKVTLTEQGRLHLTQNEQLLAGSAQNLRQCIEWYSQQPFASLEEALDRSTIIPARIMELAVGEGIAVGAPADLLLFEVEDTNILFQQIYKAGKLVVNNKA